MKKYLTRARKRIMQDVDEGLTSKEIAKKEHISIRTVETHRYHINKQFHVHSIYEAVAIAKKKGLL